MAPQPPREPYCAGADHHSLTICWKEPILDGGAQVYEYEISYSEIIKKTVGKKVHETIVELKPIRCSRWIYKDPKRKNRVGKKF